MFENLKRASKFKGQIYFSSNISANAFINLNYHYESPHYEMIQRLIDTRVFPTGPLI
jgi:hypothetical protein